MMPPVNIFLCLFLPVGLLLLILNFLTSEFYLSLTETKWTVWHLKNWVRKTISRHLKSLFTISKRAGAMNISLTDFEKMTRLEKYQYYSRKRFQEVENHYYPLIDELVKKLDDLGELHPDFIPDFTLHTFSFIKEWQNGEIDTAEVVSLLSKMNFKDVADKQLTRRLNNMMIGRENCVQSATYVGFVCSTLTEKAVPLYESYLNMLYMYFKKMLEVDQSQVKLTWLEQIWKANGEVSVRATDISLNQLFRSFDTHVIPYNEHKCVVGDNVLVFDEDLGNDDLACHWIFAPKSYIDTLRSRFNVKETMSLAEEKDYLLKLTKVYIK